jgi:hypothetical protein
MILTLWIIAWMWSDIVQRADSLLALLDTIGGRVTLQIARAWEFFANSKLTWGKEIIWSTTVILKRKIFDL